MPMRVSGAWSDGAEEDMAEGNFSRAVVVHLYW